MVSLHAFRPLNTPVFLVSLVLIFKFSFPENGCEAFVPPRSTETFLLKDSTTRFHPTSLKGKWDNLIDEDDENIQGPEIPRDMRYIEFNIMRQNKNFISIKEAAVGNDLLNDVYVRDPNKGVFWFSGKVARVSDISLERAIARQYDLIEEHASRLRPMELYGKRGSLEIWCAPGESEMDVAYNRPHIKFQKMTRVDSVSDVDTVRNCEIGFQGELYEGGEEGFRTWRTEDGSPAKPEVKGPEKTESRAPTDEEMKDISKMLEDKDLNAMFDEKVDKLKNDLKK